MRPTVLALTFSLSLAGAAALDAGPLAPRASAQALGNFTLMAPKKVEEAMEKELRPGIFFFHCPGDTPGISISYQLEQEIVQDAFLKYNYAVCKISITDQKSTRPWGSYQKLADEFGVTTSSTLVVVAYDRKVMAMIAQPVERSDFVVFLAKHGKAHKARIEVSEAANADLNQVEKWLEEKKLADAVRRLKTVQDKEKKLVASVIARMKDLDAKVEAAGKARLDEGKALLDAGKRDEAKPILDEVVKAFTGSKVSWLKEAQDAQKKAASSK